MKITLSLTWSERQRYRNNWKLTWNAQGRKCTHDRDTEAVKAMICVKATNRRVIIRFFRVARFVKNQLQKGNGDGALGPQHLRPSRHWQDRKLGGPLESGNQWFFPPKYFDCRKWWFPCKRREQYFTQRTVHTRKHFLACDSRLKRTSCTFLCAVFKQSSSQTHRMFRT